MLDKGIRTIFFDTNTLKGGWPALSTKVELVVSAARKLGLSVMFPRIVLLELERQWKADLRDKKLKAYETFRDFSDAVGATVAPPPTIEEYESLYKDTVEKLLAINGIEVAPIPAVETKKLAEYAVRRQLAFEDEGKNFQDSLIFLSMVDFLRKRTRRSALLITGDGIFYKRSTDLSEHALKESVHIKFSTLPDAEEKIKQMLDDPIRRRLAEHQRLAEAAIRNVQDQLESILADSLRHAEKCSHATR